MSHDSDDISEALQCEVLVIGSGVSGYCAAIQAGRSGCETILIEKDAVLGGNSGPDLGVGITGAERYNAFGVETGILQELREEGCWADAMTHTGPGAMGYSISRRFEAVVQSALEQAGVKVLKRYYARKPIMEGSRIAGVIAEDLAAFRTVRIDVSGCVIEASGDGKIGTLAEADFDMGSEGRSEYGERSAPDERTRLVQGTSLVAIAHRTEREVVFIPPEGTPEFVPRVWHSSIASFLHHHGGWLSQSSGLMFLYVTETGGHMDTIRDDAEIYELLLKQLWAEWDHIKNGPHKEEARCWDILWVSPKAGKRESRRFLGDYVLTQTDLEEGRRFEDDIAHGGHDLDDHQPLGEGSNIFAHSIPPMYGIPYRCCYSRNIENLLTAGRLISATHLAHSSTRIMGTGAAIGQAVGLAAAICKHHACTPREAHQRHLSELREELLRLDATILCKPNEDPSDLAREARAATTGELRFNDQEPGQFVPLIAPAGVLLWDWPVRLDTVELYLRNDSDCEQELTLRIARAQRERKWKTTDEYREVGWNDLRDAAFGIGGTGSLPVQHGPAGSRSHRVTEANVRKAGSEALHTTTATLPPGFEGWFTFDLGGLELGRKDAASDDDRLLISVDENPQVMWAVAGRSCEIAEMVEHSHHGPRWKPVGFMAAMRLRPAPMLGEAANVINGFHRRFSRGPTNMWMSAPADGLPQELALEWEAEQTFRRVCLTFDNLHEKSPDNPWHAGKRVSEMCVRDYDLSVLTDAGWRELVSVRGNYHRRRVHEFEHVTARKLRLRVLATHEEGWGARVYEVRVYGE